MSNLRLYVGGVNNITYRYDIAHVDDVFNITVYNVESDSHTRTESKTMRHITAGDVIDMCLSHYRRKANSVKGFLRWIGFR